MTNPKYQSIGAHRSGFEDRHRAFGVYDGSVGGSAAWRGAQGMEATEVSGTRQHDPRGGSARLTLRKTSKETLVSMPRSIHPLSYDQVVNYLRTLTFDPSAFSGSLYHYAIARFCGTWRWRCPHSAFCISLSENGDALQTSDRRFDPHRQCTLCAWRSGAGIDEGSPGRRLVEDCGFRLRLNPLRG